MLNTRLPFAMLQVSVGIDEAMHQLAYACRCPSGDRAGISKLHQPEKNPFRWNNVHSQPPAQNQTGFTDHKRLWRVAKFDHNHCGEANLGSKSNILYDKTVYIQRRISVCIVAWAGILEKILNCDPKSIHCMRICAYLASFTHV